MGIGELFEFEKTGRIDDGNHKITRCHKHDCEMVSVFETTNPKLDALLSCPECTREFRELIDDMKRKRKEKGWE